MVDEVLVLIEVVPLGVVLVLQRAEEVQNLVLRKDPLFLVQQTKEVVVGTRNRILHLILIMNLRLVSQELNRTLMTDRCCVLSTVLVY